MPALAINDVIRIKLFGSFIITPYDRLLNVLHYRMTTTAEDTSELPALRSIGLTFESQIMPRLLDNLPATYAMREIRVARIHPTETYEEIISLAGGGTVGNLAQIGTSSQKAAACLTRYNYKAGRAGRGRFFFGPLHPAFQSGDKLDIDPTGDGDLRDVVSTLGEDLTDDVFVARPMILPSPVGSSYTIDATCDVRAQVFAPLVSHLKTRALNSL